MYSALAALVPAGVVTSTLAGPAAWAAVVAVIDAPTDIALGKSATASSFDGANSADAAVDGSPETRWESAHGAGEQWLRIDLEKSYDLSSVHINWENAAAAKYEIQVSDKEDGPWKTVKTVTKATPAVDDIVVEGTGRFVRILGLERLTNYGYSIWDLSITGTISSASIDVDSLLVAPRDVAVVSGHDATFTAYAFDTAGNGGAVTVPWSAGGGDIGGDGTFTAGSTAGVYPVTAEFDGIEGSAVATVTTNSPSEEPAPGILADVAFGKSISASSTENSGTPAEFAVDGSAESRWSSAASDGAWIEVDLERVTSIARVDLVWEGAYGSKYLLQTRDKATDDWTTIVSESAGDGGTDSHAVDVRGRYLRMKGVERATQYGYSLFELSVWSTDGAVTGKNLAVGAHATATSEEAAGTRAENAVDGNTSSRWSSEASDDQSITLDLGATSKLSSVAVHWEGAYASEYLIQGATSATGPFTTLASQTAGAGGLESFDVSGEYRYIRVQGVHRATPFGYSIFEIAVR